MLLFRKVALLILFFASSCPAQQSFTVYTEDFPPYNYLNNDKLVGINVELVNKVFTELELTPNYVVLPWARAYQSVITSPNSLIFSIARNKEREGLFKWVGALNDIETCLFSLKKEGNLKINSLSEAKKYNVVTQLKGHISVILRRHGFISGDNLFLSVSIKSAMKMLESGRADLIGLPKQVMYHFLTLQGRKPSQVIQQQVCFDSTALYLAFNKETPDDIVEKFRKAVTDVRTNRID